MISEVKNIDCMEYMAGFPDGFFDLAVVDPPYGIEKAFHDQSRIAKYGRTDVVNDTRPTSAYFEELFRVSKNQIIWGYNHLSDLLPPCKEFIFWYKHQPLTDYSAGELAWTSFKKNALCFDYAYYGSVNSDKIRIHPTQKPIALYNWIFDHFAKEGDRILDTHIGSGSSRLSAYSRNLNFYGSELDPDYFDKMNRRFDASVNGIETINGKSVIQQSLF